MARSFQQKTGLRPEKPETHRHNKESVDAFMVDAIFTKTKWMPFILDYTHTDHIYKSSLHRPSIQKIFPLSADLI